MDKFLYLSNKYMPAINSLSYKLLNILADGNSHSTKELTLSIECDPRSALQALKGERHGYWLIHNIGGFKGIYQLDKRHLSADREQDRQARTRRELEFLTCTRRKAETETIRLPKAIQQETEAKLRHQQSFSFYHPKTEKPTQDNNPEQA